jgi:hypothetical protein
MPVGNGRSGASLPRYDGGVIKMTDLKLLPIKRLRLFIMKALHGRLRGQEEETGSLMWTARIQPLRTLFDKS